MQKFTALNNATLDYTGLTIDSQMAYFIPYGNDDKEFYENGVSITELFLNM